jgi:3-deoxy-D-manno-octulosonate 8-phosphate phosphatase (KDO 8-P phosphatase)
LIPPPKRHSAAVRKRAQRVKLLLLDVDGVLTDGGIVIDDRGGEIKRFDVRDGQGIRLLMEAGVEVGLMTGRSSGVVRRRAKELGIRILYQNVVDKLKVYEKIKRRIGVVDREVAYVGDDVMDLPLLSRVGLAVAVRGAWEGLRSKVHYVSAREGGRGAVREVVELILHAQGKWTQVTRRYYT